MATMAEIGGLAWDAGVRTAPTLAIAIAVAVAESGGNPTKIGDQSLQTEKWGPSVGIWQIRSLKAERGKGTVRDADRLTDPAFNARSMAAISSKGRNWSAWSVTSITDPAGYLRYQGAMPLATSAAAIVVAQKAPGAVREGAEGAVADATEAVTDGLDAVEQLAGTISDAVQVPVRIAKWLSEGGSWVRIGLGALGVALLVTGMRIIAAPVISSSQETGAKVAKLIALKGK